ncbi:MAG TPA: HAMP domain-containing sensor histidine kinase, partial [Ktedonobacterales bacterium]|nr:HAMP domain-containing sensor histidine kinase [Ktedonobacterales bacterium]
MPSETAGPAASDFGRLPQPGQYDSEALLLALAGMSHALAHAESIDILPLVLQELLTFTGGESGLALTCPEGSDLCRVAIRHNIAEELAEGFGEQPARWNASCGEIIQLSSIVSPEGQVDENMPGAAFLARLARAGVRWYLALPLQAQGKVEAIALALGRHAPIYPEGSVILSTAVALLSELASAALQQAQLRHLLTREGRARDEFIGLASHELKSPLTIIKGYAQLLLRQAKRSNGGAVDLNGLEAISQQVTRMSLIVGQLLDVSRIERGMVEVKPQQTDLVALVQRVVEQRQKILPDMPLHLLAREPKLMASVDPARVEQVLSYLLDNAIKFGQEQGPVEVTIERAPASIVPHAPPANSAEPDAGNGTYVTNEVALISVRDYGLGVAVEERGRLFTAFYRGPENSPHRQLAGLGLGLYLSHNLVARQGGLLWAEFPNALGLGGSLFRMSFPLNS